MLRTKLFQGFALLILIFGVLSAWFGIHVIGNRVVSEAQSRVRLDLSSAWALYDAKLHEVETVLRLAAGKKTVTEACGNEAWDDQALRTRLEGVARSFGLDFLTIVAPDGTVRMRATSPHRTGDSKLHNPAVAAALGGENRAGALLFSGNELETEAEGLAERAFLVLEDTPHARPTSRSDESRGMVLVSAVPIRKGPHVLGALYGGVLLNRNTALIDKLNTVIYADESYDDVPLGTATIFLNDSRITTTVRSKNGNRALGSRVSKEVADRVLDNGRSWIGRAFVVKDWYLTAYDPIRDLDDNIIGMLYVGILERPFNDLGRAIMWRYVGLTLVVVFIALVVAFFLAGRLAAPIHRLVLAADNVEEGDYPPPVTAKGASKEIAHLMESFNQMVASLREREIRLNEANTSLQALNASYMETLGFVTHELNTPVATMTNYAYLLKNRMLGDLTEKQEKAARVIDNNLRRLTEMIRHYLNLSRIERGELKPALARVPVVTDVITPLLEALEPQLESAAVTVNNAVPLELAIKADFNMVREVFENLLSNAVKYGREGGRITLSAEPGPQWVKFTVWNEGAGIAADKAARLFTKFGRLAEQPEHGKKRGTGLGLFITKNIIAAHGGTIGVRSEEDQWAAFDFTLPAYM